MLQRLFERLVNVRPEEMRALVWSFAYFFFLLTAYYILRPVRDEMGIAGGVENLQWLFTATFAVMLLAVPAYGAVVARLPRERFVPIVYRFFEVNLAIFFSLFLLEIATVHAARAFFVWISVFNLFVVSVFWSLMADLWRNEQGRRLFGFIAAGGSAGALVGPSITIWLAVPLGPVNLMLVAIVFLELAVACVDRLTRARGDGGSAGGEAPDEPVIGGSPLAGLAAVVRSPYLVGISSWVLLLTLAGTFVYFMQAYVVAAAFEDPGQRTRLFAVIDLGVGSATVALQVLVTGRIVTRFGVGAAAATLPSVAALGFLAIFLSPVLATVLLFQVVQRTANFALSNPAREVLFTVVPREHKYKAKNVVDTVIFRGGDALSGWLYATLRSAGLDIQAIALLTVPVAVVWAGIGLALGNAQERRARHDADGGETERIEA